MLIFSRLLLFVVQVAFVKMHLNSPTKPNNDFNKLLRVSTTHHEPFMYQNKSGKFYSGIEYNLIKTIAEKETLNLSIQNRVNYSHKIDILAGGLFPNSKPFGHFISSRIYYQDDLIWCVQKANNFPIFLGVFLAATPTVWVILIFGIGYVSGLLLYMLIQFDLKYKHHNQRDWHYTTLLIALPAVIGLSPRYHPTYGPLRIFYAFLLLMNIFVWQIIIFFGVRFTKWPAQRHQISTIAEIIDGEFRLAGSTQVLALISYDERVNLPSNKVKVFQLIMNLY